MDFYASTESLVLGASCAHGRLHLFSDWHVFEVVDPDLRPVPPGSAGTLLVTNLYNRVMPLVRYRLGDEVVVADRPCPCGSALMAIERIAGRSEDMIWLETNDGGRDFLHPVLMVELGAAAVQRIKVEQLDGRHLEVQLVAATETARSVRSVQQQLDGVLRSKRMDRSVQVDWRIVESIPPDPRTGKLRFIEALPAGPTGP